jgi:hypothetical protein
MSASRQQAFPHLGMSNKIVFTSSELKREGIAIDGANGGRLRDGRYLLDSAN